MLQERHKLEPLVLVRLAPLVANLPGLTAISSSTWPSPTLEAGLLMFVVLQLKFWLSDGLILWLLIGDNNTSA